MKPVWIVDDDDRSAGCWRRRWRGKTSRHQEFLHRARRDRRARARDAAGAGLRHPHAGRLRPRAAAAGQGAPPGPAGHHHDRLLRPGLGRRGLPGRRLRIPAQALRRRQGRRADPPRARREPARDAGRVRSGRDPGDPRPGAGDAGGVPRHRPPVAVERDGADHRRIGHRQGAGGARAAPAQPARGPAVHRHQHGGDPEGLAGVASCSATSAAPSPARRPRAAAASSRPRAARCSSTRSATCRSTCRRGCCACCRTATSTASAATSR